MKQEPTSSPAATSGGQGENPPRSRGGGRQRFGVGTVDAYDKPDWETWADSPDGKIARFGTPSMAGMISLEDFLAATGLELAPDAEVKPWPT